MSNHVGYAVVEINQASGWPEDVHDGVFQHLDDARYSAAEEQKVTDAAGRRDRYIVCELTEVTA